MEPDGCDLTIRVAGDGKSSRPLNTGAASCGLPAFFVPAKADVSKGGDENARVTFYLGFSYDGLRAWSVEKSE